MFDLRMWNWSGIGRYSVNLAKKLADISDKEIKLDFLKLRGDKDVEQAFKNINVVFQETDTKPFSFHQYAGIGLQIFSNYDIVHIPHFVLPVQKKTRLICTVHDLIPLFYPVTTRFRRLVIKHWIERALDISDAVITVSNKVKKDILKTYNVSEDKIYVIYEAPDQFFLSDEGVVPIKKIEGKDFFMVFGNWKYHNGLDVVISAFMLQGNEKLVIVGSTPAKNQLSKKLAAILEKLLKEVT